MEPYYNPVLTIIKVKTKINELKNSPCLPSEKELLKQCYNEMIAEANAIIKKFPDKYSFYTNDQNDGFNELAAFVNKQLTFGAIDCNVNPEFVTV
jgi:hypothetical protein